MDELKIHAGQEQKLVTNNAIRAGLGWDAERYKRIKNELVAEKTIIVGRGAGGLVGFAQAPGTKIPDALHVFISYSHQDEAVTSELIKHLSPLKRLNIIADWHDRKIEPGDKWEKAISENLKKADIVVLIVSIDFINSRYCYDIEMETALDRVAAGEAVMIPVIARNCLWKNAKFSHLQALPTDGKAIATWNDQDEALTKVVEGIQTVAERLISKRELL
ncbi:MAG TPA: toll/interleukin-1 receptor domain-containing protein [Roseomonas sp.]